MRSNPDVEVKWGDHPAGQERAQGTADDQRTTLLTLVSGRFRLDLTVASAMLERQGDYVVWGSGIDHSWQVEQNSVVITISLPVTGELGRAASQYGHHLKVIATIRTSARRSPGPHRRRARLILES